jgi:prepilin-type N-terminal cleavage/methylation domain-containing protein
MNKNNGFTLIELLIALSLFSLIAAGLYKNLATGIRVWQTENQVNAVTQQARISLEMISKDLRNALPLFDTVFEGTAASMSWHTRKESLCRLTVALKKAADADMTNLVLTEETLGKTDTCPKPREYLLTSNNTNISFRYACREKNSSTIQWADTWEYKDSLPRLIEIILTLTEENAQEPRVFTKYVHIETGIYHEL